MQRQWPFHQVPLKARIIGLGIMIGPLFVLLLIGMVFLRPDPIDQRQVWGCYVANGAPSLIVDRDRIRIVDGTGRSLRYLAEPTKQGYRLIVRPALLPQPSPAGTYVFAQQRGVGYFWPLLTADSDDPRRLHTPADYGGRFSLYASDGRFIVYVRSRDGAACG